MALDNQHDILRLMLVDDVQRSGGRRVLLSDSIALNGQ